MPLIPSRLLKNSKLSHTDYVVFSPEGSHLGPVKAIVQLVQERIQVRFIAQRESTVALLQQHLPELEQNLKQANLLPQSMIIQQGEASPYQMTFADTLLDVTI